MSTPDARDREIDRLSAENKRLREALELAIQRIEEDREAFVSGLMVGEVMCPDELEAEAVKEYDDVLSAARAALEGKDHKQA